jgi:two-component system response regulator FlrC
VSRRKVTAHHANDLVPDDTSAKGVALVYSTQYEAQIGGAQALLEKARAFKPRLVIIVDTTAKQFSVNPEMGGKIVRVDILPTNSNLAHENFGLLLVADMVCAGLSNMIAADIETTRLMELANRVAHSDVTVFVNGPTGTGKEVLARYIHERSARSSGPFVAINCAAIPENMLEALLFGHEKGAFTGASVTNKGIFRAAEGGTLLLDEISEMPMGLQSKLLRVLQERTVTPLGAQAEIKVDVRIIATTNRDITCEVREHRFREDLYYRLNVFPLATKSLAERRADIIPIATSLLRKHCGQNTDLPWLSQGAMDVISGHDWPGNVRELENVIQRALVLHVEEITADDIILDINSAHALPSAPVLTASHFALAAG